MTFGTIIFNTRLSLSSASQTPSSQGQLKKTSRYFLCRTFPQSPQKFVAHLDLKIGIPSQKARFSDVDMERVDCQKIVLFKERSL